VLETGEGIPLSLVTLFILIAERCHLSVDGCNSPGHFLAVARQDEDVYLIDAYHGWQFWKINNLLDSTSPVAAPIISLVQQGTPASGILRRALANLKRSFEIEEESAKVRLIEELRTGMPPVS
jgi:regulator of sirC expression with transglutaminase-like and TPR domain